MPKTESRESIVNVKEGSSAAPGDPLSSDFVRQGLVAIQAVNRGLQRMQSELAYLVNTQAAASRGIVIVGGTPQASMFAPASPQGSQWATPQGFAPAPFPGAAFQGATFPGAATFAPVTIPGAATSFTPVTIPGASPGAMVGFNPQPEPPGRMTSLNPQPLPPGGNPYAATRLSPAPQGQFAYAPFAPAGATNLPQAGAAPFAAPGFSGPAGGMQAFAPGYAFGGFGSAPNLLGGPDTLPIGIQGEGLAAPSLFRNAQDLQSAPPVNRVPPCDLVDEGSEFLLRVEVPGCSPQQLELVCYPNGLVISARSEADIPDGALLLAESGRTLFRRSIELPAEIKTHECKAALQDGILTIHCAKAVPTEGPRHLDVAYR
jgi:HSP20 family molecular chaperone IbpA